MANTTYLGLGKLAGTENIKNYPSVQADNMDIIDAEAKKVRDNFADTYDPTASYAVRDWCVYGGALYQCTTAIGTGGEAWNSNHWSRESITDHIATGTMRPVPMTIAVSDWTGNSAPYTATVNSVYVTATSVDLVVWGPSITNAKAHISSGKKSGNGGMTFSTNIKPGGSVSCTVLIWDNDDGKVGTILESTVIGIANGGTGSSTVAGAKSALGISTLEASVSTLNSNLANLLTRKRYVITTSADASSPLGNYGNANISTDVTAYGTPVACYGMDKNGYQSLCSIAQNNGSISVSTKVAGDSPTYVLFAKTVNAI